MAARTSSRWGSSAVLAVGLSAMVLASCNAVFGLEDRSFGAGGGGGAGGGSTTGTGGAGTTASTTGSTGTCGPENIARSGDFEPGWEGSWTGDNLTFASEPAGEPPQPVLHAIVIDSTEGNDEGDLFHVPTTAPACTDPCLSLAFSFYAITDFQLYVYVETDVDGRRIGLFDLAAAANSGFLPRDGGPACRLPAGFVIDRMVFQAFEPGEYLLDDVVLEITECTAEAPDCDVL